jgi:hypothetical protein
LGLEGLKLLCSNYPVRTVGLRLISASTALALAMAAQPVATVTAPSAVRVGGASIPGSAASAVPVEFGDTVSTTNSQAIVRFEGRGVVTLNNESGLKITESGGKTMICLVEGSYHYKFEPDSGLIVCKENKPLATLLEGDVVMGSGKRIPLIVASAGGGAALLAGAVKKKSKDCPNPDGAGQEHGDGHDCGVIR